MSNGPPADTSAQGRLVRTRYAADDLLQAREWVEQAYGAQLKVRADGDRRGPMTVDQFQTGEIALVDVDVPLDVSYRVQGQGEYVFLIQRTGAVEIERHQDLHRFAPGDVFLGIRPNDQIRSRNAYADLNTVSIPTSLLEEAAARGGLPSAKLWQFTSPDPVDGGAQAWKRTVSFVHDTLTDLDDDAPALLLGHLTRLLAATALTSFPNTALGQEDSGDGHDAHPETLRRAIAFIESHPDADITTNDIARASLVTPRAVQLAFRRHLDTTPMAYLRQVRLHCARQDLLTATPADGRTVTRVAQDWGFTPSRFAHWYHETFGELPSQTLKHQARPLQH